MTLHNVQRSAKRSRSRKSENFSKSGQIYYQNVSCDLTKKMNTHTLCFCPLIRKLQAFEILKWAQWSQGRKQRTSYFTREIQLIFSRLWKYSFLYFHSCEIQLFLKYTLYLIHNFLYFITLYIIKTFLSEILCHQKRQLSFNDISFLTELYGQVWKYSCITILQSHVRFGRK